MKETDLKTDAMEFSYWLERTTGWSVAELLDGGADVNLAYVFAMWNDYRQFKLRMTKRVREAPEVFRQAGLFSECALTDSGKCAVSENIGERGEAGDVDSKTPVIESQAGDRSADDQS